MEEKNTKIGLSNSSTNPSYSNFTSASANACARYVNCIRDTVPIRKNSPEDLLLRRLRGDLVYAKLRSLIPPQQAFQVRRSGSYKQEKKMEVKVDSHEISQGDDSYEDMKAAPSASSSSTAPALNPRLLVQSEQKDGEEEEDDDDDDDGSYKTEVEVEDESKPFVPSIKIMKSNTSLLISTMVLNDMSLSSTLFHLLEQEELQIDYESQYRSKTKVSHTIKVNIWPGYDVDELEKKLWRWAGKPI